MNSVGCVPIVTVTCLRDLSLLELQAQSIHQYLDTKTPIYLIVNESATAKWFDYFDQHIKHYYRNHQLTVLTRDNFDAPWNQWFDYPENCWQSPGWETQQILKLAVSMQLSDPQYLVLDTQNFLVKPWNPYSLIKNNRAPTRTGVNVMPVEIWDDYSVSLATPVGTEDYNKIAPATPFYFDTALVKSLINTKGGLYDFAEWFKTASRYKSEFILYIIWAKNQGGAHNFHYSIYPGNIWAGPYLRDNDIDSFIKDIGKRPWTSIHHQAWTSMNAETYQRMVDCLQEYNLIPHKHLHISRTDSIIKNVTENT
jgi:hypothetical protein